MNFKTKLGLILKYLMMNFYFQIDWWVIRIRRTYDQKGKSLLDVGAGECRYKQYFSKVKYLSQDVKQNTAKTIDFVGDFKDIRLKFDYILCTQVLEHLKDPKQAFREFRRLLKPGGKLFLSTNFIYQLHMEPTDYFRFTEHGLRLLGKEAGFKVDRVEVQGGLFQVLSYMLSIWPLRVGLERSVFTYWGYIVLFSPIIMGMNLLAVGLDKIFKAKGLAINYGVVYTKL